MSSEDQKDYQQQELKYKKVDAISRVLAAVAGIASALAAFLALRGYTNPPATAPQNLTTPAVMPTIPTNPGTAPAPTNSGVIQKPPATNPETLRSPSTQPTAPASAPTSSNASDDDDDDNDDADDD